MGRGRRVMLAVTAAVILGVGLGFAVARGAQSCTKAGCTSGVMVDLETLPADIRAAAASTTVCVDDVCSTSPIGGGRQMAGVAIDGSTIQAASLVVLDGTGATIARVELGAPTEARRFQPNGPSCEPTCWFLGLTVADGALVPLR